MAEQSPSAAAGARLLLIGRGYVARRLAERLAGRLAGAPAGGPDRGSRDGPAPDIAVVGATHRPDGGPRQAGDIRFGDTAAAGPLLEQATHLLVSAPPDGDGDPTLRWLGAGRLAALPGLRWIGYLSSTGVYGDHGGAWIDEDAPLRPRAPAAVRRARAERQWLDARAPATDRRGLPVTLFRLSGIYGPGRSSFDALDAGRARRIDEPGHVFCRCHVDDICAVLRRSMAGAGAAPIYNVADDLPAPQRAAVEFAAGLAGAEPPPLTPYDPDALPPGLRRFYEACRRIRNGRIKDELGIRLRYPTYREGLRAIAQEEGRI
ncbi:MAG: SDR family NAD(P)-dependent oxidoreductase [Rhodospirillaceae bacterium]|nr:SDR family NAD(P)-dependent oxidoreductase [Rhodospirillaceae bacterium]